MLLAIALIPLSLAQRYRRGSARRVARGWVTTMNLVALAFSSVLLLVSAGFTGLWVPDALKFTAIGLLCGALAGMFGTWLTRWEETSQGLYYTPPRILVLLVTTIVVRWPRCARTWSINRDSNCIATSLNASVGP